MPTSRKLEAGGCRPVGRRRPRGGGADSGGGGGGAVLRFSKCIHAPCRPPPAVAPTTSTASFCPGGSAAAGSGSSGLGRRTACSWGRTQSAKLARERVRFSRRSEIGASVPFVAHRQNRRSRAFNVGDFADAICKNALAAVGMGPYARVDDSWRHSEKKNKRGA